MLREAMAREFGESKLEGVVEIDGGDFGGYVKPKNKKVDRKDRRSDKRQSVVIMRERKGRSLPFMVANEGDALPFVRNQVGTLATIHADKGIRRESLHAGLGDVSRQSLGAVHRQGCLHQSG